MNIITSFTHSRAERHNMNKTLATLGVGILAASLTLAGATVASATETCTPSPAWSETVVITPAVPAIPALIEQSHAVNHEAVEAVTTNDYQRYSWVKAKDDHQTPIELGATPTTAPERWQANTTNYEGAGHGTDPIGVAFQSNGNGHGNWFFWTLTTTTVEGSPAWDELVVDVVGSPEIPGTDAVVETVDHAAVECPPVVVPPIEEPPVVVPSSDVQLPTIPVSAELAYTGSSSPIIPIGIASLFLAVGAFLIRKAVRA
jgi:hypothetical protein